MLNLFMYQLTICISSVGKCLFNSLPIFKIWFFFFYWIACPFYSLDLNPLSVKSFAKVFSHSICCLFICLVSFAVQELFTLLSSLFIFAFVAKSKKSLLRPTSRSLPPRFSSQSFMVLSFLLWCCVTLIDLQMLYHPWIPGINSTRSLYMILLMYSAI